MSDLINVLKDVTSRLDRAGVRYMISGSMALNYYALPRMTRVIDLVVEMTIQDLERVSREFSGVYYMAEESMRTAVAERGVFNLIHLEALIKIDFVVRKEGEFRTTEFSRRREAEIGGAKMFIVAPEDLLLSKLAWSRGGEAGLEGSDSGGTPVRDTSVEIARQFHDMIMKRGGEERLRMGSDMFEASREIVLASLMAESPVGVRERLFRRFYGADFGPADQARIVEEIRRWESREA